MLQICIYVTNVTDLLQMYRIQQICNKYANFQKKIKKTFFFHLKLYCSKKFYKKNSFIKPKRKECV